MHVRYPRAAVAVGVVGQPATPPCQKFEAKASTPPLVLWASFALRVRDGGRLVGVRRHSSTEVEVALLEPGHTTVQWLPARLVLTEHEARQWLKVAHFSR